MELVIGTTRDDDGSVISVGGDVDLYSSPRLRDAVFAEIDSAVTRLAIDLSEVRYMDSSGVATLVEGLQRAKAAGAGFKLIAPSPKVMQVLEMTRLDSVFEIEPSS
jgi:anti-sigma B factor antagonist